MRARISSRISSSSSEARHHPGEHGSPRIVLLRGLALPGWSVRLGSRLLAVGAHPFGFTHSRNRYLEVIRHRFTRHRNDGLTPNVS